MLEDNALRAEIIRVHYDDPLAGHFGPTKISALILCKYTWLKLKEEVNNYITLYTVC
jgi:hypothetical protein